MTRFIVNNWTDNWKEWLSIIIPFLLFIVILLILVYTAPKCPKCDDVISNSDRFCKHCGYKLRND